jgi:VWFA-related protein
VRAKNGALAANLQKDDFSLAEDGLPQTIRYFARETDLPLTLGLMVDTSSSQRRVLNSERGATLRFLDQIVRPRKDQVFLMQFDSAVQLRQPLTSNPGVLDDALAYVDTETNRQVRIQNGGGTLLYDAVIRASNDIMARQTGRKALIILSDGVDVGSYSSLLDAVETAQRADALIYSILYADPGAYGLFSIGTGATGRHALERLSSETGGSFYEVTKKRPVESIFETIEHELRTQYNIGYVSTKPVDLPGFRSINLTVKQKDLTVQSRRQYWAR